MNRGTNSFVDFAPFRTCGSVPCCDKSIMRFWILCALECQGHSRQHFCCIIVHAFTDSRDCAHQVYIHVMLTFCDTWIPNRLKPDLRKPPLLVEYVDLEQGIRTITYLSAWIFLLTASAWHRRTSNQSHLSSF